MNRTKVLLFVVGALAVAATVAWQRSFEASIVVPQPVQLRVPPTRATGTDLAPVAAANDVPAVVPVKDAAKDAASPVAKKPSRAVKKESPAVVAVAHTEAAPLPSTPEPVAPPATSAAKTDGAETYEAMAALSLRQRNFVQAREEFESALSHGGKATFMLLHDHTSGNFDKRDPKATCVGELTIQGNEVRFIAPEDPHGFAASWSDVRDAGGNKFFGSGIGGFHVTITADGKYRNFNLAPESRDKAEGKLILDLLTQHSRKSGSSQRAGGR